MFSPPAALAAVHVAALPARRGAGVGLAAAAVVDAALAACDAADGAVQIPARMAAARVCCHRNSAAAVKQPYASRLCNAVGGSHGPLRGL